MNIYARKQLWKLFLLLAALLIGIVSLWYTNQLVKKLSEEEKKKVELWAQGTRHLANLSEDAGDISFVFEVIKNNTTVPVILADQDDNVISFRNLDSLNAADPQYLKKQIALMRSQHEPIEIALYNGQIHHIYYKDSILLTQLKYYPYFQLGVIALFLAVSYLAFSASRKAEQNQVWIGMAKETAHQLGTPLSSLIAWIEYLKLKGGDTEHTREIEKDVERLKTITERFSKIGSSPILKKENVTDVLRHSVGYIRTRVSEKVSFEFSGATDLPIYAPMNIPLFEWVIENLLNNAVDAMSGEGKISIALTDQQQFVYIDISDTGKGVPKSAYKTIFKPGYTTKSRGWGLGLSLAKRIIEEYHSGHIFVKSSEVNKGTTFRIVLNKQLA